MLKTRCSKPTVGTRIAGSDTISWEKIVIADVDGNASPNELRSTAFRHVRNNAGGYTSILHDPEPVNEFVDPFLFPMMYTTLFPYGISGFKDPFRDIALSMDRHINN